MSEQENAIQESAPVGRGRGRSVANMTMKAADNLRTDTDARVKFKREVYTERANSSGEAEFNLGVPPGTVPAGYVGLWVLETGKGEVEQKLREWWGHLTDAQGVNITRPSAGRTMYLMAIEESLKKEMDDLQMRRYRDSIGDNEDLGVDGVESYTPKGETNKIKVTSDPFAM